MLRRSALEREMDDEVQSHLEHRAEDLVRAGYPPAEARRLARLEFGPVAAGKDDMRTAVGLRLVDELHADVRQTLRRLRRSPSFALTTIAVLAAGIAGTTAIFSVVYGVLIQPLPYRDPQRLIALTHRSESSGQDRLPASPALYFTYREHNRTFESVALWAMAPATITGAGSPEEVRALETTFELLPLLGVRPRAGRVFTPADDRSGSARTVILTDGYWQRQFGAGEMLGRRLTVDGVPHEIIGVLPRSFRFLRQDADIVLPLQPNRARAFVGPLGENGIARLRPDVTIEEASRDVERMMPVLVSSFPPAPGTNARPQGLRPDLRSLQDAIVGDLRDVLWVMMGTIAILLVMACANVANLQLVHAESRHQVLANVQTLADYYRRAMDRTTLTLMLLGVSSGMALLLGLVGIYAVVSHIVSTRLREIGIRLALGAQIGALRRMPVGRVLALVLVGLVIGIGTSTMLASLMETLLFGVTPRDAATYFQVSVLVGLAALCAGYLPAQRITRLNSTSALRAQ